MFSQDTAKTDQKYHYSGIIKMPDKQAQSTYSPVSSHTEWDLLEEAIVGIVDGASFPPWHVALEACLPNDRDKFFCRNAGKPFPPEQIAATKNLS